MAAARRHRVVSWLVTSAFIAELVVVGGFVVALAVGERTRVGFVALYLPRQPLVATAVFAALLGIVMRRRAMLVVQGIVCLVALNPVMGLRLGSAREASRPIRLATYNVYFGKLGRSAVLDEIARRDADVVLLQATWDSMADRLRERFPDRTVHREGELVLVSRFPLRHVEVPSDAGSGIPAMYVGYVIDTPQGPVRIYNVHPFSPRHALYDRELIDENLAQREAQIAAVVAAARREGPPFVIAGDTNLPGLSAIARRHLAGLRDAFDEVGLGFGYTFPSKLPWMRIDRVLASDGVRFVDITVAPRGASDHRALFVDFDVDVTQ